MSKIIIVTFVTLAGCSSENDKGSNPDGAPDGSDGAPNESSGFPDSELSRFWIHAAETSAVVYFRAGALESAARSYVEYGRDDSYGQVTSTSDEPRLAQLHRLTGLEPATQYHYRMVLVTEDGEVKSDDQTFTTESFADAIRIPRDVDGPPYSLDQEGALYVLTEDIEADNTAIVINARDVTLELDGHTVTFGNAQSDKQVRGVLVNKGTGPDGAAVIRNGHFVDGAGAGGPKVEDSSAAIEARWRSNCVENHIRPLEVFGITTDIDRPQVNGMRLFGADSTAEAKIHHNHFLSGVTEVANRHYPGNHLLDVDACGSGIEVTDNLFTQGPHWALDLGGDAKGAVVAFNDIRHDMQYTNGYALGIHARGGVDVHHNKVTSQGRGAHLTKPEIQFHDNYLDLVGHSTRDFATEPKEKLKIELHGVKLETASANKIKVFNNFVRGIQLQPDEDWYYTAVTPMNLAVYNPNGNNEIYDNTFIALTTYQKTRHGGYADSGEWAAPLFFVAMNKGEADGENYAAYIHDNEFISNDLFVATHNSGVNMTVRIADNTFTLVNDPPATDSRQRYYQIGERLKGEIESGNNTFVE